MNYQTVLTLEKIPNKDEKILTFVGNKGEKKTYPKFIVTKFTKLPKEWKEGAQYTIKFSAVQAKDKEGNLLKATSLFLREVKPAFQLWDGGLGTFVIKGIVGDIKEYQITTGENMWDQDIFGFRRIKVKVTKDFSLYVWEYDTIGEEMSCHKGDTVTMKVRLFNKQAYDEEGYVDNSPEHIYKDKNGDEKPRWYTEIDMIECEVKE